jgi:RNA polymerase sigma-70 factor (ECF subfamily)
MYAMRIPTAIVVSIGGRRPDEVDGKAAQLWHHRRVDADGLLALLDAKLGPDLMVAAKAAGLIERLEVGLMSIAARWPEAPAIGEPLAGELAERIRTQPELATALPRLRLDDLFLAWWARSPDPRGMAAFEAAFADDVRRLVQRFHRLPADELRQQLRIKLFVGTPARPPRIAAYSGFGFLQNWIKVTAARSFVDAARSEQGHRYADELDEHELLGLPSPTGDPRDAHERDQLRGAIKRAFAAAVASLAPRERTFLRHASVDRLTLDQIAATYHVHRATVARVLASGRERLLNETRAGVVAELGIAPAELSGAMTMLDSRLELSLSRVLRVEPGAKA